MTVQTFISYRIPTCLSVLRSLPHLTVNPLGVAAVTQGVDGGPGLSGLVVQTSTSLGLLFPSMFDAMSCSRRENGRKKWTKQYRRSYSTGRKKQKHLPEGQEPVFSSTSIYSISYRNMCKHPHENRGGDIDRVIKVWAAVWGDCTQTHRLKNTHLQTLTMTAPGGTLCSSGASPHKLLSQLLEGDSPLCKWLIICPAFQLEPIHSW